VNPETGAPTRWRRTCRAAASAAAAAVSAGALALAAAGPATAAATLAPLAGGAATASGSWAVVAVGHLSDPLNTFWQLLFLGGAGGRWKLVTPPGVADNGGLTGAFPASGPVTIGVEPSQELGFSPLARSSDGGAHWATGLVPSGLAAVPDALAVSAGSVVALTRAHGGTVLASTWPGASWVQVTTRASLVTVPGACAPVRLGAVAVSASGTPFVGATCVQRGRVGVFTRTGARWQQIGPRLGTPLAGSAATLLRLTVVGQQLVALAETTGRGGGALVVLWRPVAGGAWTVSAPWPVSTSSGPLVSAVGPGVAYVVLLGTPGAPTPVSIAGPGRGWTPLPAAPVGTAALAPVAGGVDAFSVKGARVTVSALDAGAHGWQRLQVLDVPLAYGSSG